MKNTNKNDNSKDLQSKNWRSVALRVAAIFLIIVFLASECAPLLLE